jgi:D-alanyl-D-alanine carboxypeptidase (penicillin-binding protein 5/6)
VVDDSGRVLFARAAAEALPNASTTKMTTALVTRDATTPDESVMVSATAASIGGGGLDLHTGEVFSVEALLYALLLDSSNEAAVALAEHVAGSHEAFVNRMNIYASALGTTGTRFVTAHGLDMPGHTSTATDLALIATEVLADPLLAQIVATPDAAIDGPSGTIPLENRNLLLEGYRGATGVKTGFTAGAGNVLVASATRSGRTLIAVAMHSVDATADAAAMLDFGWERLQATVVLRAGAPVGALVFDQGSTPVVAAAPVRDSAVRAEVTYEFVPAATMELPLDAGAVVGRVVVSSADGPIETVDALAVRPVAPIDRSTWAEGLFSGLLRTIGELVGASS